MLNTPSVIDTSWAVDEIDGIHVDAVLFVGYTGMHGGLGIADVLLGRVNPSGKTNDTWAKDITDYPSTAGWDEQHQAYEEDIFVGYLEKENEFATPVMLPALSADHPSFSPTGGYWCGGVWAPTSYMVLKGLDTYEKYNLSHKIGLNYLQNVVSVFNDTGTVWENYAPMLGDDVKPHQGGVSHSDFVGWTGIVPISVLFEYVFGIKPDAENNTIRWNIDLKNKFGVDNYPFGKDTTLSLQCSARKNISDEPDVEIKSDKPVTVQIYWDGGSKSKTVTAGSN